LNVSSGEVIVVNVFFLEYSVLVIAFLVAAYHVFKEADGDTLQEHHEPMGRTDKVGLLTDTLPRMHARNQTSEINEPDRSD